MYSSERHACYRCVEQFGSILLLFCVPLNSLDKLKGSCAVQATIVNMVLFGLSLMAILTALKWGRDRFRNSPEVQEERRREKDKFAGKMFVMAFSAKDPNEAPPAASQV